MKHLLSASSLISLTLASSGVFAQQGDKVNTTRLNSEHLSIEEKSNANDEDGEDSDWQSGDWDDSDWNEKETSPWQSSAFVELAYGQFAHNNITHTQLSLAELRSRLNLSYTNDYYQLNSKFDYYYDEVVDKDIFQTRELNISSQITEHLDVKLGRQVLTWGTGDYVFLNDLFAKDWQAFFSGRSDEYLKAPSNSARLTYYFQQLSIDLAYTPDFSPDNAIKGERFAYYSPQYNSLVSSHTTGQDLNIKANNKTQAALRLNSDLNGLELAFYAYQGYWTTPQGIDPLTKQLYYPKLNSWGASIRNNFAKGIINLEYASYNSLESQQGRQILVSPSQSKFLIGYEKELSKNINLSAQYYLEHRRHYEQYTSQFSEATTETLAKEYRHLLTLRLRYSALQQTLTYSLFSFYSPSDDDFYIKPSLDYRYNDEVSFALGTNIFGGKKQHSFFGQHKDNSNIWLRAKYQFNLN